MTRTVNLSSGSTVPKTGKYKCEFCDEGRVADFFGLKGTGLDVGQSKGVGQQSNTQFFKAGQRFTECHICGPATGWTLVEEASETGTTTRQHHDEALPIDQKKTPMDAAKSPDRGRKFGPPGTGSGTLSAENMGDERTIPSASSCPSFPEESQKKRAMVYTPKLSKGLYVSVFFGAFVGLFAIALLFPLIEKSVGKIDPILLTVSPLIMFICIIVIKLKLVGKMWSVIQDGHARTTPGKAALFLLIPFFNIYWIFRAFWGFAKDYNAFIKRHSIDVPRAPGWVFLTYCILTPSFWLLPSLSEYEPLKELMPPITASWLFVWIAISTIMIVKICNAVNAIPAEKIEETKAGKFMPDHQKDVSQIQDNYDAPLFLFIPIARLILLSIASMGAYQAYWIYKNWRYIKERENLNVRPFWRGVFGILFCHSLLRRIHEDMKSRSVQIPSFSPGGLATGWVVLTIIGNIISRAPGVGAGITALVPSFLCLVPVQRYINSVTEQRKPFQLYYGWSTGHIVCLVFGVIIWFVLLSGFGDRV